MANKSDIISPQVSEEEGRALAEKFGLMFFAASAKTGHNVEELFNQTCKKVIEFHSVRSSSIERNLEGTSSQT